MRFQMVIQRATFRVRHQHEDTIGDSESEDDTDCVVFQDGDIRELMVSDDRACLL